MWGTVIVERGHQRTRVSACAFLLRYSRLTLRFAVPPPPGNSSPRARLVSCTSGSAEHARTAGSEDLSAVARAMASAMEVDTPQAAHSKMDVEGESAKPAESKSAKPDVRP